MSDAKWVGYWTKAVAIPETGKAMITYDWYRSFLQFMIDAQAHAWFDKLIAYGEVLVGLGLIVGVLVGTTAFFRTLMNFSFMLAGSASTNPILFLLAVVLMLGWKVAGYYGVGYLLPRLLGVPWKGAPSASSRPR